MDYSTRLQPPSQVEITSGLQVCRGAGHRRRSEARRSPGARSSRGSPQAAAEIRALHLHDQRRWRELGVSTAGEAKFFLAVWLRILANDFIDIL